ncbi:hypothetical protein [Pseudomonas fluorescens]
MSKSIDSNTWLQEFTPLVNGQKVDWDEVKLNLMKGETCTVGLDYKYSWLIGTDEGFLALECKSGTERGLIFDPPLGQECEMAAGTTSLNWRITSDSSDIGLFELQFALPKYPELSKSPLIPGRLISNWSDGFIPLLNDRQVEWPEARLISMMRRIYTLTLSYENNLLIGDPSGFVALDYVPGAEGRDLVFDPPLRQLCAMEEGTTSLSWQITISPTDISLFALQFSLPKLPDVSKSPVIPGRLIRDWSDGFTPLINGQPVSWSALKLDLMVGDTCTLTLEYKNSGLIGEPDAFLALQYAPGSEERGLVFDPPLGLPRAMAVGTTSLNWLVTSEQADAGHFALQFVLPKIPELEASPSLQGRLIEHWSDAFVPLVNGQRMEWPDVKPDLMVGQTCTLTLSYEDSILIGDPGGFLALEYTPGAEGQGLVFDPPLGQPCAMADGTTSLSWVITSDQADSGTFELQFSLPKFPEFSSSPSFPVKVISHDELVFVFDTFPFKFPEGANPCHGATHTLYLSLEPDSPLVGRRVKLIWEGEPPDILGVEVTPGLEVIHQLDQRGLSWKLDFNKTSKNTEFFLKLEIQDFDWVSSDLRMSLGHNLVTATKKLIQDGHGSKYVISATSVFLDQPAPGVFIAITWPEGADFTHTQADGTATWPLGTQTLNFRVVNSYDGTFIDL